MNLNRINKFNIDQFIDWVDQNGGPEILNQPEVQTSFKYTTSLKIEDNIDPASDQYLDFQLKVYREISNREVNQELNEQTSFNIKPHIKANNPYNINDPSNFVFHYIRLGHVIKNANLIPNPRLLDMGCGWGLSSEYLATLGAQVTSVDINPDFIELINKRSQYNVFKIETILSSFSDFFTTERFDGILFYECLHHSIYVRKLIVKLKYFLKPGGVIMLAGEPIQSMYWKSWGMRLDALSVYCIRKFGWFESGWSENYIKDLFVSEGFDIDMSKQVDPVIGYSIVAKLNANILHIPQIVNIIEYNGWFEENDFLVSSGEATISNHRKLLASSESFISDEKESNEEDLSQKNNKTIVLSIFNFSSDSIKCSISTFGSSRVVIFLKGHNTIELSDTEVSGEKISFRSDSWTPSETLNNNEDNRVISFHLFGIELK